MTDPARLVALLADDDRLRVVAALALGATTAADVACTAGLDARRAGRALSRLQGGGLVDADGPGGKGYRLRVEQFAEAARTAPRAPEAEGVLGNFLRDGRLTSIPVAHGKRVVVLDWLAAQFEPGHVYPEAQVNEALLRYHEDYAALRRYLVDDGFLERRDGFYWRTGGTFEIG